MIAAAVADLAAFLAVPNWIGVAAIGAIGYLLFSAFGAGFTSGSVYLRWAIA